jgi:uncharacterized protein YggE
MEKSKIWFWILFDVLVGVGALTLLFGLLPFLSHLGASYEPARVISVSAQGLTTATPDMAELSFSVVTQGKNPADLSDNNNVKMNAVVAFVKSQGIADADVKTTSYDLQPNYSTVSVPIGTPNPFGGSAAGGAATIILPQPPTSFRTTQTIVGYTLTQTVDVKIRDLTKVAAIVGGLAPLGINQIGGVSFTFSNPEGVTAIARADALQKAKTKAAEMAAEAGVSLGGVINLNESSFFPSARFESNGASALSVPAPSTPPISPGTQDITDNVNVTYELK